MENVQSIGEIQQIKKELEEVKTELIDRIMESGEPDQILIDLLGADLYSLAENLLKEKSGIDLFNIYKEIE